MLNWEINKEINERKNQSKWLSYKFHAGFLFVAVSDQPLQGFKDWLDVFVCLLKEFYLLICVIALLASCRHVLLVLIFGTVRFLSFLFLSESKKFYHDLRQLLDLSHEIVNKDSVLIKEALPLLVRLLKFADFMVVFF